MVQIDDITELKCLSNLPITELMLDGNPLCDKYDRMSYVQMVKDVCPKLERLVRFPIKTTLVEFSL